MADANAIYKRVVSKFQKENCIAFGSDDLGLILSACIIAEAISNSLNDEANFSQQTFENQGGNK